MKFGQSIEHKKKNIFLDKSYTECENVVEKLFSDHFLKNQN